jgi:hypothetical protein
VRAGPIEAQNVVAVIGCVKSTPGNTVDVLGAVNAVPCNARLRYVIQRLGIPESEAPEPVKFGSVEAPARMLE